MTTNNVTNQPELTTNGQLLIGSTSANPVAATLTAGTGITVTNGAGSITIAASGGSSGSLIWLATKTYGTYINFDNLLSSTYDNYLLVLEAISPASTGGYLLAQFAHNSTPTYLTSGYYGYVSGLTTTSGTPTAAYSNSVSDVGIQLTPNVSGSYIYNASGGLNGTIQILNVNPGSDYVSIVSNLGYRNVDTTGVGSQFVPAFAAGCYSLAESMSSIRLLTSGGSFGNGTVSLYGYAT